MPTGHCIICGGTISSRNGKPWSCASCAIYNAAVAAEHAAAESIARERYPGAERAWLNRHGVFAFVDNICTRVGSAEEAAVFVGLTTRARAVENFWSPEDGDL